MTNTYHSVVDSVQEATTPTSSSSSSNASTWQAELKHLLSLAGPMIFTLFMESLHATISVVLVGQIDSPLATEYVDAATMASMFTSITSFSVGLGLASALDTLCTQAHGAGNTKQFGVYFQSAHLGMALTFIPVVILNWFSGDILTAMGQDAEISGFAGTFTRIITIGLPFYFVYQLVRRFLQAHDIVYPMTMIALLSNVVHIGLGYYLCYHTSLGFNGAAIARCVSYVVLPLLMLPYFVWRPIHREWGLHWNKAVAVGNLREFFRFGIPGLLMVMMEYTAFEVLTLMAGWLPNHKVMIGINSVLINLILIFYMVFLGISFSATIRIGNYLGANKPDEARRVAKMAIGVCASLSFVTGGTMLLARHELPKVFINDVEVVEGAAVALCYVILLHMIDAINAVNQGIFRGIAKPVIATAVNAGAYYLIGLPMAAVCAFALHWDVNGLFGGFTLGAFTACSMYMWQLSKINWAAAANEAILRSKSGVPLDDDVEACCTKVATACNGRCSCQHGDGLGCSFVLLVVRTDGAGDGLMFQNTIILRSLHHTISNVLVGRINSPYATEYVAAATMASMFATITSFSVSLGLASALDTLCAQAHGAGNTKQFGVYFQSAHLGMALVLLPVVLINWFSGDILTAMGQDAELSALAGTFLVRRFLQAYDIVYPMTVVALLSNVVHIGLGYYLCYHTSLGFNGAAIARCVSYVVLPLLMLPYFVWRPIHREWGLHWNKAVAVGNLREFFRFGVPGLLLSTMEYTAFEILTLMAGWLPNHKVMIGINSIVQNISLMLYMVYVGISIAATIRVGNLLGANRPDEARRAATLALVLCIGCSIVTGGSMVLARDEVPTLFLSDPAILAAAPTAICYGALQHPEIATVVNAGAYYLVGLPLAALAGFGLDWGINGVLGAFGVGTLTATGLELYQFAKIDWRLAADTALGRNDVETPLARPDDKVEVA
ncbi:hypothetical protein SDRG_03751 [Saprolegnia diclina VS20]|uniref:Multidrug/Oligosaccharidyl-lipid/Polysaccharide (MOP) Flippase Superfamily n=1 Tax=Saprolegnia diclina (strain VS20) TaxID=1156394 RepID=T0S7Q9_SAPDV|nr:hypothetical protein SDRG_03751 [Saprolegnia diclina VS20]EQC38792.1 hypothetical protein SDRG_03751 [Saprolegnia diclina VS20]|eukprot:XP_008607616.1 hypothetical protein SDRG_03751 [Saprolegnia diclina VS20]